MIEKFENNGSNQNSFHFELLSKNIKNTPELTNFIYYFGCEMNKELKIKNGDISQILSINIPVIKRPIFNSYKLEGHVIEGYHDLKQYKKLLEEKFCSLVPKDVERFSTFSVTFYERSRFTKENMTLNTFNRHYHKYIIADYSCQFGVKFLKTYYIDFNMNKGREGEEFSCKN
ncbi:MAG: hypothetical protein HOP11_08900 [Saprospiraceae bacterium]|nr:hypothetical protein [Saprospiraceae bacterium]